MGDDDKATAPPEPSYVLVARDYADIAHLENPGVIERILSTSRTEKVAYVSALLTSGLSKYAVAGPKVAVAAMTIEALTDLGKEVSNWVEEGKIPGDFSGRPAGYQTWVELLQEIDSNPVDGDRLKAMKAMFLAANGINATDGDSILAYQLFRIAKALTSGELLLLKVAYANYQNYARGARTGGNQQTADWRRMMAHGLGHGLSALVALDERKLVGYGLIAPWIGTEEQQVPMMDARMTDLGIKFCQNIESYEVQRHGA
jgi:hypothetical protein